MTLSREASFSTLECICLMTSSVSNGSFTVLIKWYTSSWILSLSSLAGIMCLWAGFHTLRIQQRIPSVRITDSNIDKNIWSKKSEKERTPFCKALEKSGRKIFDEMFVFQGSIFLSACSDSVQIVTLIHPIIISILFHLQRLILSALETSRN